MHFRKRHKRAAISSHLEMISVSVSPEDRNAGLRVSCPLTASFWPCGPTTGNVAAALRLPTAFTKVAGSPAPLLARLENSQQEKEEILVLNEAEHLLPAAMRWSNECVETRRRK